MDQSFRIGAETDYEPQFSVGPEMDYQPSFEPEPASPSPEPERTEPAAPAPTPKFNVGAEMDFQPTFKVGEDSDFQPTPAAQQGAIPVPPSATPGDKPFGSDWSFIRGLVTSGVGGNLQGLGGTIDAFNLLSDGDPNSTAGKAANFLDALGKKGSAGYELQAPSVVDVVKSPSKAGTYLGEQTGSLIGSMGPTAAGWALGTAGGAALGEAIDPAGGGVPGGIVGGYVGSYIPSFIQNTGDTLQGMLEDAAIQKLLADGTLTQKNLAAYAVPTGAIVAGLDSYGIGEVMKLSGVSKEVAEPAIKKLVISTIAKAAASHGAAESATEGAQQLIQETATVLAGGNLDLAKRALSVLDASVSGFLGGGLFGGGHETYHALKPGESTQTPSSTETGVIPTDNAGTSAPGGTNASTPPPPAGAGPTSTDAPLSKTPTDGGVAEPGFEHLTPEYNRVEPVIPGSPAAAAAAKSTQPETIGPVAPDAAAALTPTPAPAGPPAVAISLHPIEGPQASPMSAGADVSAAIDAHNAADEATSDARRNAPAGGLAATPSPQTSPPTQPSAGAELPLSPSAPGQVPPPSGAPTGRVTAPPVTLPASSDEDVVSERVQPRSATQQTFERLTPPDGSFTVGEPVDDFVPQPAEAIQAAPAAPPVTPAVTPGEGLSKTQRAAFDDIAADIQSRYDDPNDPRIQRDLEAAHEFIRQQPLKQASRAVVNKAVKHLNAMRAQTAAVERAAANAPAEREARRQRLAAEATQPRVKTPEQLQEDVDRAERSRIAEDALSPEQATEEGAEPTQNEDNEALNKQLDDIITKTLSREADTVGKLPDPALERATAAGGGGSKRGGGSGPRGPAARPGTPQFKATRILRRAVRASLRHILKSGGAKTRRWLRQFVADHDLATDNEWRFDWTDHIDPEARTEQNPMRQVSETRAREHAKRERLTRPFKQIVDRLDRLRRRNPEAYAEMGQLMADASSLKVDPTKPANAPENAHLGGTFTKDGYQGRQAHKALAARYDALVKSDPEIAQLWSDLQTAFAERRAHETRARVVALVRQVLDRNNERERAAGRAPPPTGNVEAEQLADRVINKQLTKTDAEMLSPSVRMALQQVIDSGKIPGTYLPFVRQGNFAVHWKERMQLPNGGQWAKDRNGKTLDDIFTGDKSAVDQFVKSTVSDGNPNTGLNIRQIRAFKEGPDGKPVFRREVTAGEFDALTTPVQFEVQVQRRGMSLHNTQSEAEAAHEHMTQHADDVHLQEREENKTDDLIPANVDEILKKALFDLRDTGTDDSVTELLDKTMRDAVASVAAGNAASARRLHRKNVSGAEGNIGAVTDRYSDASSGAIAKLEALPELETGMRGMRYSDEEQSHTDPKGQLARQQMISEWQRRVSNPNDHYTTRGSLENNLQAALNVSYLTRLGDIASALVDLTQPYLMGAPRLMGRSNPIRAYMEIVRAEKAINTAKLTGKTYGDAAKSAGEALSKGAAAAGRLAGKEGEGARLGRSDHFEDVRNSVGKEKDGRDLQKMLDSLADVGLLSRESATDIKGLDPSEQRGLNRILEPLSDIVRQLRIGVDIRNQSITAVAAYRIARQKGDTHAQAVEYARDTVRQSQFDSTHATGAPAFKQRGLAKFPLQFKRFTANSLVGIARMMRSVFASKNMTPEQRKEWRRIFAAANVVTLAASGISGHPLAMVAGTFMQALALAMGEPPREWEAEIEEWFTRMFSEEMGLSKGASHKMAASIMRGLPSGLGPVDVAKRIGFGDLIVQGKPESMDAKGISNWLGQQVLGAPGDTLVSPVDAGKALLHGDVGKAAEALTPKFIANLVRAGRGGPTNAKGDQLTAEGYSPIEMIAKGIGLQPTREADLRRQRTYNYAQNELRKVRDNNLRKSFEDAPNYGEKHKAWLKIQQYNKTVPEDAQITDKSLERRQKDLMKDKEKVAGDMQITKKNADIARRSRSLNPADHPPRKKVVEYEFN
ncbi:PLxRFG domain-containing protein [Rhizobium sp. RAF56]|uniref:PLxRFG domain-containing protein n=1 Tax=Rhizobium sp. RAF56 TaxID=3233062 RepID=UPI003F9A748D